MTFIGKVTAGGNVEAPIAATLYGTCDTAPGTQTKVIVCSDYDLAEPITGMTIHIKFNNTNTYNGVVKLNINNKGAKNAYKCGNTNIGITEATSWAPYSIVSFTYDGGTWIMNDHSDGPIVYTPASTVSDISYTGKSVGSSTAYAREDHIHYISKAIVTSALGYTPPTTDTNTTYAAASSVSAIATAAVTGTSTAYARADHVHNITKATITNALGYTPPTTDNNTTYSAASSTTTIAITSSVTGTSTAYARADHVHGITKATITGTLGYTPISPSNLTDELDDFEESLMTTVTPSNVSTASAVGVGGTFARADHVHGITKATITTALGYTPPQQDTNTHTTTVSTTTPSGDYIWWIIPD